jgi:hypothetical protein
MCLMLPPHPDIEIERVKFFNKFLKERLIETIYNTFPKHFEELAETTHTEINNQLSSLLTYWLVETKLFNICERTNEVFFVEQDEKVENFSFFISEFSDNILLKDLNAKISNKENELANDSDFKQVYESCFDCFDHFIKTISNEK